jgi:integrase
VGEVDGRSSPGEAQPRSVIVSNSTASQRGPAPTARTLSRAGHPGVYRRGDRYVVVYRRRGRQRKKTVGTFTEARTIKLTEDAAERSERLGPTLHGFALEWTQKYAGQGPERITQATRKEYARLLATFPLSYFPPEKLLASIDADDLLGFVTWLGRYQGRGGRLTPRSIANALVPLRLCMADAERAGLIQEESVAGLFSARRSPGPVRDNARFLTRSQLGRVMGEIPSPWLAFFELLATTGLRISEAIALRWMDLELRSQPHVKVRRSIVKGVVGSPKSRFGWRQIPLGADLAESLCALRPDTAREDFLVFSTARGTPINPGNLRSRVLAPAVRRAGLSNIGFHAFRHTCASLLIERGLSLLRLQLWMGHHSAAYTIDTYGHLIDDELSAALDLVHELDTDERMPSECDTQTSRV